MSKQANFKIKQKFREYIERKDLTKDIKFIFQTVGGMPSQRIEEEFRLSSSGKYKIKLHDVMTSKPTQKASGKIDQAETFALLQKIASGLDSLVPRSEARFPPDAVVSSITIVVGGEEATLYFLTNEHERKALNNHISLKMNEAIQSIRKILKKSLKKGKKENE